MDSKRGIVIASLILISMSLISAGWFSDFFKGTGNVPQQSQNVSVSVSGGNPVTIEVPTLSANPLELDKITVLFTANVSDADGVNDIDDSSITAELTNGATTRTGSCVWTGDVSSIKASYNCSIDLWYFDASGSGWTLNVTAKDFGTGTYISGTSVFTYNQLKGIVISPTSISWSTVTTGASNQGAANDPTTINNTGNYNGPVFITGLNLLGETTSSESIPANNFSVSSTSGQECTGTINIQRTALVNGTQTSIAGSNSNPGNLSAGGGQSSLYYCIPLVPTVSSQVYSTTTGGSWAIQF